MKTKYIGADESGKGDIFGPMVVAAVYTNEDTTEYLIKNNIKDSKLLSDKVMLGMESIITQFPHYVYILNPREYNELYAKLGNQELLLKVMYEEAMRIVHDRTGCSRYIIDKFSNRKGDLFSFGPDVELEFIPRAEIYTGVAAASVLARIEVIKWFNETGLKKGSSLDTQATLIGKKNLEDIAKTHFKSVKKLGA